MAAAHGFAFSLLSVVLLCLVSDEGAVSHSFDWGVTVRSGADGQASGPKHRGWLIELGSTVSFPLVATLHMKGNRDSLFAQGTLFRVGRKLYVLMAAHSLPVNDTSRRIIDLEKIGITVWKYGTTAERERDARAVFVHAGLKDKSTENDIALIELEAHSSLDASTILVDLPGREERPEWKKSVEFSVTKFDQTQRKVVPVPMQVKSVKNVTTCSTPAAQAKQCSESLLIRAKITDPSLTVDKGDGGAGAIIKLDNKKESQFSWKLLAMVVGKTESGLVLLISIPEYADWIEKALREFKTLKQGEVKQLA